MIDPDFSDFAGRNILIVEDDCFLAEKITTEIRRAGAVPLGPVADIRGALAMIETHEVHAATLYLALQDAPSLALARILQARAIPVAFVTGFDDWYGTDDLENPPAF